MNDRTSSPALVAAAAQAPKSVVNAGIQAGAAIAGLVPTTLEDVFRLSRALACAGEMVPDAFREKPDAIMAAVLRGLDVGLRPMQALGSIAVINGRACFWGDALPAIMQRAGHQIDHVIDGEGDDMVAVATLIRGDTGQKIVRTFSVADAKRAGLWQTETKVTRQGKNGPYTKENDSPWFKHPKRMLAMRARSQCCRDGAADAMMGMGIAEEERDNTSMRDVTPSEPKVDAFAAIAQRARETAAPQPAQATQEADQAETQVDAEEAQEAHWTDGYDPVNAIPGSKEWDWGEECATHEDRTPRACPFEKGSQEGDDWLGGFYGKRRAME